MKRRRTFSQKRVFELKSSYICREYRKEFSLKLINLLRRLKIFLFKKNKGLDNLDGRLNNHRTRKHM